MNLVCQHECNEKAQKRNSVNASQATMEQPSRTIVHAKLEMTNPDSQEEVEADAAANDIVQGGKIARSIFAGSAGGGISVSSQMEGRLNSMQGGGQVMPDGLRNMMERGFNRDFSQVRLHTDSEAASLSSSIHAKAFTHGNDIYFNQGQFSPNTSEGQKLMAHELTHVVQGGGKVGRDMDSCNPELQSCLDDYTFLSNLSVKSQQLKEHSLNRRYQKIGDATETNLQKKHNSITIAFIISNDADGGGAFSSIDEGWSPKNDGSGDGILNNLLAFQPSSIKECIEIIEKCKSYGPLQNVIISGHGNWDSIMLTNDVEFTIDPNNKDFLDTMNFFAKVNESLTDARIVNPEIKQSIYLDACLTNSHVHTEEMSRMNFKEVFQGRIDGNVSFIADSASAGYQNVDNADGSLSVKDKDESILTDTYTGLEVFDGRARRIAHDWISVNRDISTLKEQVVTLREDLKRQKFKPNVARRDGRVYLDHVLKVIDFLSVYNPNYDQEIDESVTVIARYLYNFYRVKYGYIRRLIKDVISQTKDANLKSRLMELYHSM